MTRHFSARRHLVYRGIRHFANLAALLILAAVIGAGWQTRRVLPSP